MLSWWTNIQIEYIFYINWILKAFDKQIILFWCPNFRVGGVKKSLDRIYTFNNLNFIFLGLNFKGGLRGWPPLLDIFAIAWLSINLN